MSLDRYKKQSKNMNAYYVQETSNASFSVYLSKLNQGNLRGKSTAETTCSKIARFCISIHSQAEQIKNICKKKTCPYS